MRTVQTGWLLTIAAMFAVGCRSLAPQMPLMGGTAIPVDATKAEIVAIVNRNFNERGDKPGLSAWQAEDVSFSTSMLPGVRVPGMVIVEAPRNLRLRVQNPITRGDELDVGSNSEEFWIWQKDTNPPYLFSSKHEDLPLALEHFRLPFQPDWIMEVLGVVPIDENSYTLQPSPEKGFIDLVAEQQSPTREAVRKVIRVDMRKGCVTEHSLWSESGKLLAKAELDSYRVDPKTKMAIPGTVRINWPDSNLKLAMNLGRVEVNPSYLPEVYWQLPQKNGYTHVDIGARIRAQQQQYGKSLGIEMAGHQATVPDTRPRAEPPVTAGPLPFPETTPTAPRGSSVDPFGHAAPPVAPPAPSGPASFSSQAPAFPGEPVPSTHQPVSIDRIIPVENRPLPPRDNSLPPDAPGRVRLDSLSQ